MAGVVGIEGTGRTETVRQMLERIAHRGESGAKIIERHGSMLGAVWSEPEAETLPTVLLKQAAWDGSRPPLPHRSALERVRRPFALTAAKRDGVFAARDPLGVCPLYYGRTDDGALCLASEVKALLGVTEDVQEFPLKYAISIPAELKLRRNGTTVDKWILRQALSGVLPENLLRPPDMAFWRGAGLGFLLALSAEEQVTDAEYYRERVLPNGWILQSKEAMMYYRIFRERFGEMDDLSWMGREEEVSKV